MSYVEPDAVIARYPLLEDWGKSETEVSSDLIHYAEIELNGLLGGHFTVPFTPAHPTVQDLTIDLCYDRALRTKDPDKSKYFHDLFMKRIGRIIDGEEFIYTGSGTILESLDSEDDIWSSEMDYHPIHSMLEPDSTYTVVDSSLIADLEDER